MSEPTTLPMAEAPQADAERKPLLRELADSVMKRGGAKYRKPKRFGRAVALIARLYGLLRLSQMGKTDVVTGAELLDLQKELAILLEDGDLARLEALIADKTKAT